MENKIKGKQWRKKLEKIREKIVNRKYNFELLIRIQRKCTNAQQIDKSSQYYNNSNNKMNEKNKRTKKTKTNGEDEEKNGNNKCIDACELCRQECE